MAGAEKLKEKILDEAKLVAGENLKQAREEAEQIVSSAQEIANKKSSEILEKAKKEAEEKKSRAISSAELDARKMRLQAKQELIEETFKKALEKLNNLPEQQYVDILTSLVVNAVTKGQYELILSGNDKIQIGVDLITKINTELKTKMIDSTVMLSSQVADIKKGFILKSGDRVVNSSFEAVLKAQHDELEAEVVKALF